MSDISSDSIRNSVSTFFVVKLCFVSLQKLHYTCLEYNGNAKYLNSILFNVLMLVLLLLPSLVLLMLLLPCRAFIIGVI